MSSNINKNGETRQNPRLKWMLIVLAILSSLLILVWWPGCRQYPTVTSEESLQLIKLVYSACNTRDNTRLSKAEARLEKAIREGKLTDQEEKSFRYIMDLARQGYWEQAERAAFKFAQDQVQ